MELAGHLVIFRRKNFSKGKVSFQLSESFLLFLISPMMSRHIGEAIGQPLPEKKTSQDSQQN